MTISLNSYGGNLCELRHTLLDVLFCGFRWWRRLRGGKWELWWVDIVHSDSWHPVTEFSRITGSRPTAICRGTAVEEDWTWPSPPPPSGS